MKMFTTILQIIIMLVWEHVATVPTAAPIGRFKLSVRSLCMAVMWMYIQLFRLSWQQDIILIVFSVKNTHVCTLHPHTYANVWPVWIQVMRGVVFHRIHGLRNQNNTVCWKQMVWICPDLSSEITWRDFLGVTSYINLHVEHIYFKVGCVIVYKT